METTKENKTTTPPSQPQPPAGMPDWVMHLLTGAGTMIGEYMLFIKPLQEKMELQSRLIKEQDERIRDLEELLQSSRKQKQLAGSVNNENEERDNELFQLKQKPAAFQKYSKYDRIKL